MSTVTYLPNSEVVVIDYEDLVSGKDFTKAIEAAFGFHGLGLITIRGIPGYVEKRAKLLPLAREFALLPESVKEKTIHEESLYSFGWSHGKEKMKEGKPDLAKGSYYANPQYNEPFVDEQLIKDYPTFCHPNIWPREDFPQLEPAFMSLGHLIVSVGTLLAKHCDAFIRKECPEYPEQKLANVIATSRVCKARLLHYFPIEESFGPDCLEDEAWCGWHNDHGSLTGLTSAMFLDAQGNEVPCPDEKAGLYVASRKGTIVKVNIPADHLAFQIGETAQIHSGGILQATPHFVRGAQGLSAKHITRETLAVFMEPEWPASMAQPESIAAEDVVRGSTVDYLPEGVPQLEDRWDPKDTFGEFSEKTFKAYY